MGLLQQASRKSREVPASFSEVVFTQGAEESNLTFVNIKMFYLYQSSSVSIISCMALVLRYPLSARCRATNAKDVKGYPLWCLQRANENRGSGYWEEAA